MQFTRAEEYGILGVIYLSEQPDDRVIALSEIADAKEVPEKFLAKIFQNLTKTGIVRSHRGVKGGFTLSKDPHTVTVRDVVEAIQGPYHLVKCLHDRNCCDKYDYCPIRSVLQEAEVELLEVFDSYTISDLRKRKKERKSSRSGRAG
ncbi:MAG: Rrf2 family transcriptional regulator [Candidatus Zixiibacteriota bacterium]|nr:MAG: Rrf2 family transcriptional regulator [candidate division Zixibacteria bacterium]